MDKISSLSLGEKLIGAGGIIMLVASFLPWYKVSIVFGEFGRVSASFNGWEAPGAIFSILATLIAVALAGTIAAVKFGNVQLPPLSGSLTWGTLYFAGGVATLLLVAIKLLNESSALSFGFFLGLVAALVLAGGGYLLYSEEKAGVTRSA